MQNDLFLRALLRQPVPRTPVWMMRQAGRYLPEYRAVRKTVDFLTLCKTPDLATEVTIQPVDILGVDAAIIFSDILVVPEAMGMELIIEEGQGGPCFPSPLRTTGDIEALAVPDPGDRLKFVTDAIALTKRKLNGRVPLIGFCGSPWTLASYMVEGRGSRNFRHVKELIFDSPQAAHLLLEKIARAVSTYLNAQIAAGAQAVQIFDTWGGILSYDCFEEFSLRYIRQVIANLKPDHAPVIVFCKDCGHSLERIAASGCQAVGLDWSVNLGEARTRVGSAVALQGNMDPTILYARPDRIRTEVRSILKQFGTGTGHVFNLGHGILPDVPVEHAREFIRAVKEESPAYHN